MSRGIDDYNLWIQPGRPWIDNNKCIYKTLNILFR